MKSDEILMNIRAEAAAWLARLHSDDLGSGDEAGFRAWLYEDERHQQAFDQITRAWELAGGAARPCEPAEGPREGVSRRAVLVSGMAAVAAASATGLYWLTGPEAYATEIGEQRRIALADGSVVMLDTDTRIEVTLQRKQRLVELVRGRANFRVAPDRDRPFVVRAGDRRVLALGTAFDVSQHDDDVAVLLVEGQVEVQPVEFPQSSRSIALSAGERVVFHRARMVVHDRLDLTKATAWQTGRLVFDNVALSQAAAELNRYSRRPLIISDAALGARRISGIYDANDAEGFANSISLLISTSVRAEPKAIFLDRAVLPTDNID